MALFEGKTPAERNKMIAAIALPLLALILVFQMFSGPSRPSGAQTSPTPKGKATPRANGQAAQSAAAQPDEGSLLVSQMTPIDCCPDPAGGGDAGRNIFAFYVKPVPPPPAAPTATPEPPPPPPPIMLGSLAPQSVFARTAGFTLQLNGDKFGPGNRVYVDGQELPTQYRSMQQLSATVPASVVASPGQRSILVRTPDGKLFSNPTTLNVMQPPAPTYTFIGFLKRRVASANTAVLKDPKGELHTHTQGDIVEGRFRITNISERGVEVVDKDLNIKHTMPFVDARGLPGAPGRAPGAIQPPPPPADDGDEEP